MNFPKSKQPPSHSRNTHSPSLDESTSNRSGSCEPKIKFTVQPRERTKLSYWKKRDSDSHDGEESLIFLVLQSAVDYYGVSLMLNHPFPDPDTSMQMALEAFKNALIHHNIDFIEPTTDHIKTVRMFIYSDLWRDLSPKSFRSPSQVQPFVAASRQQQQTASKVTIILMVVSTILRRLPKS